MNKLVLISSLLLLQISLEDSFAQSDYRSEEAIIQDAKVFFMSEKYTQAAPLYAQLVSTHPLNNSYHYNYGICLLMAFNSKGEAVNHLEIAAASKEIFPGSDFYLAKAYHINYQFAKAIGRIEILKKNSKESNEIKKKAEVLLAMCKTAQSYNLNPVNEYFITKEVAEDDKGISLYNFENHPGRFLAIPEKFYKGKNKEKFSKYVFLSSSGNFIVFSGPGKSNTTELFISRKRYGNEWNNAEPVKFKGLTTGDKITPVISADGDTIYFSWCGTKSFGGFDVFKSVYNLKTNLWSEPENMGPPINSVYDDFNFLPSAEGDFAYVSSSRDCNSGKINVLKIKLNSNPSETVINADEKKPEPEIPNVDSEVSESSQSKETLKSKEQEEERSNIATDEINGSSSRIESVLTANSDRDSLIFKIQLGAFRSKSLDEVTRKFKASGIEDISYSVKENGVHVFYTGETTDFSAAIDERKKLIAKGLEGVFVVAFCGTKQITIKEANLLK